MYVQNHQEAFYYPRPPRSPPPLYVGIDVARDKLDLARDDGGPVPTFANDPGGIAAVVALLAPAPRPAIIVVEATARLSSPKSGGLERPLVDALLDAGLPVALVHPGRDRYFAKCLGILAKTDRKGGEASRIDAARLSSPKSRVLRRFGQLGGTIAGTTVQTAPVNTGLVDPFDPSASARAWPTAPGAETTPPSRRRPSATT